MLNALARRVEELERKHGVNPSLNQPVNREKEKYMSKQFDNVKSNSMLLFGGPVKDTQKRGKGVKESDIRTAKDDIAKTKAAIEAHKKKIMGQKKWNKKDREIWEKKMKLEMVKTVKAVKGTASEKKAVAQKKDRPKKEPVNAKTKAEKAEVETKTKSKNGASKSHASVPWDTSIPLNMDGSVKLHPEVLKRQANSKAAEKKVQKPKKEYKNAWAQRKTNPLKLVTKGEDAAEHYVTNNKTSYGSFYSREDAVRLAAKEYAARKDSAKANAGSDRL